MMDGGQHLQKVHHLPVRKRTDILRIQEKSTKTGNITLKLPTGLRIAKAFLADEYLDEIQTHQDQSYSYYRAKCFRSFKVCEEPHNLKLVLCIASWEVEYAYCGPSCTAGKSGFCNHILALMCPLVWLYCLYEQRAKRGDTLRENLCDYYLSTFFQ